MTWFIGRSIVVIVLGFVLGLVVGWLWWRRRKVQFSESRALAEVTARKDAEIQARDDEIGRLIGRSGDAGAVGADALPPTGPATADTDTDARRGTGAAPDAVPAPPSDDPRLLVDPPLPAVEDPTAGLSVVPTDPAPEQYESHAVPVEDIPTGGISVHDVMAAQATAATANTVEVPVDGTARQGADPAEPSPRAEGARVAPSGGSGRSGGFDGHLRAVQPGTEPLREPVEADQGPRAEHEELGPDERVVDVTAADEAAHVVDVTDADAAEGDDLERIEGVGPRIGAALRNAGIHTFRDLADADTATLQGALEQAGLRFAPSLPTWGRQARFLAEGDEAGFSALTRQLVGGPDISRTK